MIWKECGSACPPKCDSDPNMPCTMQCVPGCFCPPDAPIMGPGGCIPKDKCPQPPEDKFDCRTKEVWTDEKKAWCCKEKQLGCADEFDCSPNEDWSVASAEKKRWCCAVHRTGCPPVDPCEDTSQDVCKGKGTCVYQPKKCVAGPDCPHFKCQADEFDCSPTDDWSVASAEKKRWCCAVHRMGCPQVDPCEDP
eukprot:535583_1